MPIIDKIDVRTRISPQFSIDLEKEPGPLGKILLPWLRPSFTVHSDFGDFDFEPYGPTPRENWFIPLAFLTLAIVRLVKK